MRASEVMEVNAHPRNERKEGFALHHVEIHPERDEKGRAISDGGHVVHTVMRRTDGGYEEQRGEKPFGKGEHEKMLAHVANALKLPEPAEEEEEEGEEATGAAH